MEPKFVATEHYLDHGMHKMQTHHYTTLAECLTAALKMSESEASIRVDVSLYLGPVIATYEHGTETLSFW